MNTSPDDPKTNKQPRKAVDGVVQKGRASERSGAPNLNIADNTAWLTELLDNFGQDILDAYKELPPISSPEPYKNFIDCYEKSRAEAKQAILSYMEEHKMADLQDSVKPTASGNQADTFSELLNHLDEYHINESGAPCNYIGGGKCDCGISLLKINLEKVYNQSAKRADTTVSDMVHTNGHTTLDVQEEAKSLPPTWLLEGLAAIEHERWADWQRYMHFRLGKNLSVGVEDYQRWQHQIATPYGKLSEVEKQSDRDQVMLYWDLIQEWGSDLASPDPDANTSPSNPQPAPLPKAPSKRNLKEIEK